MAAGVSTFKTFTIRVAVRGSALCLARLLDCVGSEQGPPRDSMLCYLPVEFDLPSMPRFELREGSFLFDCFVPEDMTAEQVCEKLIGELARFGFEAVPP